MKPGNARKAMEELKEIVGSDVDESLSGKGLRSQALRVYEMNDCDWWAANSLEQARDDYSKFTKCETDDIADAYELSDEELETKFFWRSESRNIQDYDNWKCECGATADSNCRWNGKSYEHHNGYPVGHVEMKLVGRITFKERLRELIAEGVESDMFATTEF